MTGFPDPASVPPVSVQGFPAVWRVVGSDACAEFGIYVLADPDAPLEQLDEAEFEATDERLPYFASLWPSGDSLAAFVLATSRLEPGTRVLDLGCGLGAQGLAAAVAGGQVTFVDWDPRALELVAHSAEVLGVEPSALETSDWRELGGDARYDRVLGADLLYEARNVPAVLEVLSRRIARGGEAWIADPGRDGLASFVGGLPGHGLRLVERRPLAPRPHGVTVTLLRIAPMVAQPPVR